MCSDEFFDCNIDDRFGEHNNVTVFVVAVSSAGRLNCGCLEKELLELLEGLLDVIVHCGKGCILSFKL